MHLRSARPPGTTRSATAALVELMASSSASLFDFISDYRDAAGQFGELIFSLA